MTLAVLAAAVAITIIAGWVISALSADPGTPDRLEGSPVVTVGIGGTELTLVEAVDTARGLAGVDDLGDLDGMLFAYPTPQDPASRRFHMTGVRFALDALFFDAEGRLIEVIAMPVCAADPCPHYAPPEPYRWVVEVPAGSIRAAPGTALDIGPRVP